MKKLIEMTIVEFETFEDICKVKAVKDGNKWMLANDNSVFFHEDLELVDATPDVMGIPSHKSPNDELSLFYVGGEYRLYNLNMELIDSAPVPEMIEGLTGSVEYYYDNEDYENELDYLVYLNESR